MSPLASSSQVKIARVSTAQLGRLLVPQGFGAAVDCSAKPSLSRGSGYSQQSRASAALDGPAELARAPGVVHSLVLPRLGRGIVLSRLAVRA